MICHIKLLQDFNIKTYYKGCKLHLVVSKANLMETMAETLKNESGGGAGGGGFPGDPAVRR